MLKKPLISIVAPVYNEEAQIEHFCKELFLVLKSLKKYDFEVILVDDGSSDRSQIILKYIARKNKSIKVVVLSRNFGHQAAISAGLDQAKGDATITLDSDLEDPPEKIPQMLKLWQDGAEIVRAKRISRLDPPLLKFLSRFFYRLQNIFSSVKIHPDTADFRLIDKKVLEKIKNMKERSTFLRGLISWIGFRQAQIEYNRAKRKIGLSKFTNQKRISLALEGALSFSGRLLFATLLLGFASTISGSIWLISILILKILKNTPLSSGQLAISLILFFSGVIITLLGFIAKFSQKIYFASQNRPPYVISEKINFKK